VSTRVASPAASSGSPNAREAVPQAGRGAHRQPGLADPAGPAQRDEAVPLDGAGDGRQFPPPADKPGNFGGKIIFSLAEWQRGHDRPRMLRPAV
jgi:hypothetical protein